MEEELDWFLVEVGGLGDKLPILLLQLPPSFDFDAALSSAFTDALSTHTAVPIAF